MTTVTKAVTKANRIKFFMAAYRYVNQFRTYSVLRKYLSAQIPGVRQRQARSL